MPTSSKIKEEFFVKKFNTKVLTGCAIMIALQIIFSRFFAFSPSSSIRLSIEAVPIFLAGAIYGPIPGLLVGLASDLIGSLIWYGFNPLFCVPPMLYGLTGGFFNVEFGERSKIWHFAIGFLPPFLLGTLLYQSAAMAFVYGRGALLASFIAHLTSRAIPYTIVYAVDVLVAYVICSANFLERLLPPRRPFDED